MRISAWSSDVCSSDLATPRIPRQNLQRRGDEIKRIHLNGPMGDRDIDVPANGDFALPPLDRTGISTLSPAVPQFEPLAVRLTDDRERGVSVKCVTVRLDLVGRGHIRIKKKKNH